LICHGEYEGGFSAPIQAVQPVVGKTVVDSVVFTSGLFFLCLWLRTQEQQFLAPAAEMRAALMLGDGTNPRGQEPEMRSGPDAPGAVPD
jgi:hypothetical protein